MNTNEEKTVVSLPESVTINGVTYNVKETPELQAFMQSVSKVEKSKLYSQFESLKQQFNTLSKIKVESSNAPLDVNQLKQDITAGLMDELLPKLKTSITEIVQPVLAATEKSVKDELDTYREKLINENLAVCIPDLVKGNNKEELNASLQESIRIRGSYPSANTVPQNGKVVDPLIQKQLHDLDNQDNSTKVVKPIPTVPSIPAMEVSQARQIKSMSMEEFAKNRETLLKDLESAME